MKTSVETKGAIKFDLTDGMLNTNMPLDGQWTTNKAGTTVTLEQHVKYNTLEIAPLYNGQPIKKVLVKIDVADSEWYAKQRSKNEASAWRKFAIEFGKLSLDDMRKFVNGETQRSCNGKLVSYSDLPTITNLPVEAQFDANGKLLSLTKEKVDAALLKASGKTPTVSLDQIKKHIEALELQLASTQDALTRQAFEFALESARASLKTRERLAAGRAKAKTTPKTPKEISTEAYRAKRVSDAKEVSESAARAKMLGIVNGAL